MCGYLTRIIEAHEGRHAPRTARFGDCQVECCAHVFNPALAESSSVFVQVIQRLKLGGRFVVDAGCGVGVLGITAAQVGATRVLAFDCNVEAVRITRRNAVANGIVDLRAIVADGVPVSVRDVDLIVCNPPFFDCKVEESWHRAFCDPGHGSFYRTLEQGGSVLKAGGSLLMACGGDLAEGRVSREAAARGWAAETIGGSDGELRVRILRVWRAP